MKKRIKGTAIAAAMLLVLGAGTAVFAQDTDNLMGQTITVDGTLQLQNGSIVLAAGNTVYFVPMLIRYIGFIDGLKEGAAVSVQGYVNYGNMLMPTAVRVNGKSYDFSGNAWGGGYGPGYGRGSRRGGGCGCW